jgi:hypothetical protein
MPIYVFQHPDSLEIKEIFLGLEEEKKYIDLDGVEWQRVYSCPNLSFDTRIDPYSKKAFLEKTKKSGTVGDLFDLSKEMSEKRGGVKNDPVKKNFVKDWKKKRNQ